MAVAGAGPRGWARREASPAHIPRGSALRVAGKARLQSIPALRCLQIPEHLGRPVSATEVRPVGLYHPHPCGEPRPI